MPLAVTSPAKPRHTTSAKIPPKNAQTKKQTVSGFHRIARPGGSYSRVTEIGSSEDILNQSDYHAKASQTESVTPVVLRHPAA